MPQPEKAPPFTSWCKNGPRDFGTFRPSTPVSDLADLHAGDVVFVEDKHWNALNLFVVSTCDTKRGLIHIDLIDPLNAGETQITPKPITIGTQAIWDFSLKNGRQGDPLSYAIFKAHDLRNGPQPTMDVSWVDTARSPRTKHTVCGVAWWRDETSAHDPHTLRVLYSQDGRKLGGPIIGWMISWQADLTQPRAEVMQREDDHNYGPTP